MQSEHTGRDLFLFIEEHDRRVAQMPAEHTGRDLFLFIAGVLVAVAGFHVVVRYA